jgi:hypothetical protein
MEAQNASYFNHIFCISAYISTCINADKKKKLNELTGKLYKAVLRELCWKLRNLKQFREHISLFFLSAFSITAI